MFSSSFLSDDSSAEVFSLLSFILYVNNALKMVAAIKTAINAIRITVTENGSSCIKIVKGSAEAVSHRALLQPPDKISIIREVIRNLLIIHNKLDYTAVNLGRI